MSIELLVFHPQLNGGSTANAALAAAADQLPDVHVRDLYALYPDEQIAIVREQELLSAADKIVLQFPVYWYSSPALLKKYLDEVLSFGWAYGTNFALQGKKLKVAATAGAPITAYTPAEYGFELPQLLAPFQATANYLKMVWTEPFLMYNSMGLSPAELAQHQAEYQSWLMD